MPASVRQSPDDCAKLARADALLHKQGDLAGAIAIYRDVLKRFPADPELLYHLGSAELMAGNLTDARRRLAKSVRMRPTPAAWRALAKTSELSGDVHQAVEEIERGLALAPENPALRAAKADILFVLGEFAEAHDLLAPLIDDEPVHAAVVTAFARLAPRFERAHDAVRLLERSIDAAAPQDQAVMAFRLAALLDSQGDCERAFAAAERANRLRAFRFDADAFTRRIDETIANWVHEPSPMPETAHRYVFIVGMPRSGTSLVERMVGNAAPVLACGERADITNIALDFGADPSPPPVLTTPANLTTKGLKRAVSRYSKGDVGDGGALSVPGWVTDKMPTNFLNLGLIARLFSNVRVVHCIRDPRDTCLSCYFQSFADGLPFAGDLAHLAVVQNAERRLMAHWKRTLDIPIFDLVYEDLVEDVPGHARRLIDFLGLDWHEACATPWLSATTVATASVDQVRRPVYTSSAGRWRHYEAHLAPLIENLT